MPHSTMKNNRNIIECCNNSPEGATYCQTDMRLSDASRVTCRLCRHYFNAYIWHWWMQQIKLAQLTWAPII